MRGKKSTQILKGTTCDLFYILETKMREREKGPQPNISQVSIYSDLLYLRPEAPIDSFIALG